MDHLLKNFFSLAKIVIVWNLHFFKLFFLKKLLVSLLFSALFAFILLHIASQAVTPTADSALGSLISNISCLALLLVNELSKFSFCITHKICLYQ
jgi:hypothetical protein